MFIQWVYNCLEYKREKEMIKYDTATENDKNDENNGFLLLPDLKWSGKINELYLLAIVKKRNIKSLRDLTAEHLPLLKNILSKGSVRIYLNKQFSIYLHNKYTYKNIFLLFFFRLLFINCMEYMYHSCVFMSTINHHSIICMFTSHI